MNNFGVEFLCICDGLIVVKDSFFEFKSRKSGYSAKSFSQFKAQSFITNLYSNSTIFIFIQKKRVKYM